MGHDDWIIVGIVYATGCAVAYLMTLYFAIQHKRKIEKSVDWTRQDAIWLVVYTLGSWISFFTVCWCHWKYIVKNQR
jgi:hypothetical protein